MEEHLELLHSIPNHFDESVVYYTDGSQGKLGVVLPIQLLCASGETIALYRPSTGI